ncbi:MAG: ribosome-binding factor A [Ilumatobacteraceae bacterium]|jgi:ribosome-binding factor A|nr:ribosome-binding factor A [Ilumatobacteraceae bacterium]
MAARPRSGAHRYPRSARVSETIREILADELVLIGDERLELVSITKVDVDNELNRGIVYFDSLAGAEGDAEILEAFGQLRVRLQAAIARQIRAKKTPVLDFRPDEVIRAAERIDEILRNDRAGD